MHVARVVENVVVAIAASAVTWVMSNPDDSAGAADAFADGVVSDVAPYGTPILGFLWAAATGLLATGAVLRFLRWRRRTPKPHGSGPVHAVVADQPDGDRISSWTDRDSGRFRACRLVVDRAALGGGRVLGIPVA